MTPVVFRQERERPSRPAPGEFESVTVQSTYMHGRGPTVPAAGKRAAVAGEHRLPLHRLLGSEDRHQR